MHSIKIDRPNFKILTDGVHVIDDICNGIQMALPKNIPKEKINQYLDNVGYCLEGRNKFNWGLFVDMLDKCNGFLFNKTVENFKITTEQKRLGEGGFGIVDKECGPNECIVTKTSKVSIVEINSQIDTAKEIIFSQWLSCDTCQNYFVRNLGCQIPDGKHPIIYMQPMDGDTRSLFFGPKVSTDVNSELILQFFKFLVKAVDKMHDFGIINFDIKEGNVLYKKEFGKYSFALADFGLSNIWGLNEYNVQGTLKYIPGVTFYTKSEYRVDEVFYTKSPKEIYVVDYYAICCVILDFFAKDGYDIQDSELLEFKKIALEIKNVMTNYKKYDFKEVIQFVYNRFHMLKSLCK